MDFTFTEEQETISGARVAATAQQVHGGIGIDISYHRHFRWAKHNELSLGPASAQLARLGTTYPRGPEGHL